ncbi:similar to Saccharomyces cerevisiae YFL055W AGP3 Low-affinity amino acid permease [Geotrichum candidum]|uniref:Similar to Saccharomyces cerevisiae YFL055W AGP3 Low-affinity amino acid permease n=1 Tax=Geotrichum candidum TaxID=1173061 RepID=A0A0J9XGR0_GEOCN|nr:similar to Saccharomyces cerevisiae YFL055W AGP3 Low-affinity amino acid permease [Geotrichum candidum]
MSDTKHVEPVVTGVFSEAEKPGHDNSQFDPNSGVKRALKNRHLSMMALAGIIGPGLMVGTGGALAKGGPAALMIGFGIIGMIAFSITQSIGEITTLYPTGGAFIKQGERFVDKAFAFAMGWNYFVIWVTVLANEYNVLGSVLSYWSDVVPLWGWFLILWFAFGAFQMLGVESFGEAEFWLALIKIIGLFAYFIFAIVYAAGGVKGQPAFGFRYWHNPGAFANGFRGVASVFVYCSTYYAGVESVAIAATETKNPAKAVPTAVKQVFFRIIVIFMGCALFFGLCVPYNDEGLLGTGQRVLRSPITIAIQRAGWEGGTHLVNAFIVTICLSACNSAIYIGSRSILFMAQDGTAPRWLGWTNKQGVPVYAVIFTNAFGAICLLNLSDGAAKAYGYIVSLSGVSTFIVWGAISFIHIRFRKAWHHHGFTGADLPFESMFYPYNMWFGLIANIFLALVQSWAAFAPWNTADFVVGYILLPLFFVLYFGYKWCFKTKYLSIDEIDLFSGRRMDLDASNDEEASPVTLDGQEIDETSPKGRRNWKNVFKSV